MDEGRRGPLHISADGGKSGIALFEVSRFHGATTLERGAAFSADAEQFVAFARRLPDDEIRSQKGPPLGRADIVDFDLCYAYNFQDPWGNRFELNCYDVAAVKQEWIDAEGIEPVRYW